MRYCLGLLFALFLTACATPSYLYYGNSSHSYYRAVKKQDEKSVSHYKASLENVFKRSENVGKPVPPGLYCDYAMLLLAENRTEEARIYFQKEKQTWSEAQQLIDFLMLRYKLGN
ncbi:MAG: DUF4810 domain-containing protein [Candidatus Cloacimonas sp.]|jgi:hypothetical protein|nr:DUF4810 domain-containing protein [Candidatus Cloacimonas sp.]